MGIIILKYWFIVLPSAVTGLYLLQMMHQLYRQKMNRAVKPAPIAVNKRG